MSDALASLTKVWPGEAGTIADDDELAGLFSPPSTPWLRMNFVSSVDGSATRDGRSGGLSDAADKRVFGVLRRLCDVVVVGAGTVRAEGYGGMAVDDDSAGWRRSHGLAEQPRLAVVSRHLDLDSELPVFAESVRRPLVLTCADAPARRRAALEAVADVVDCGTSAVEPARLVAELAALQLPRIHCEGGPTLFGALAEVVDELCLTLSPVLAGGDGPRITRSPLPIDAPLRLAHVLASGSTLLLRYLRP